MENKPSGFLLFAIIFGSIAAIPAFAESSAGTSSMTASQILANSGNQSVPLPAFMQNSTYSSTPVGIATSAQAVTVATDKSSYNDGDKITISGTTRDYMSDTPLTLIVRNPVGNVVKVDQVQVGTDKTFSATLTATGLLWQAAGTYTVSVQYGSSDRSAKTTFDFTGSATSSGPGTIPVDGTSYSISYTITNGKVLDIKANPESKSLIVSIQTTGDGLLTITMPRELIDAKKSDGTDDQFIVLNDGQQNSQANETMNTATDRTMAIPFKNGTQQIEIVGTFVIPEYGPVAAMVLAIAIVSIIAISKRTGLKILPRY